MPIIYITQSQPEEGLWKVDFELLGGKFSDDICRAADQVAGQTSTQVRFSGSNTYTVTGGVTFGGGNKAKLSLGCARTQHPFTARRVLHVLREQIPDMQLVTLDQYLPGDFSDQGIRVISDSELQALRRV